DPVGDLLVRRPAHQAVIMLRQPLVAFWEEDLAASAILVDRGPALDHPSLDPAGREDQVEGPLLPGREAGRMLAPLPLAHFPSAAGRTCLVDPPDLPGGPQGFFPRLTLPPHFLPEQLVGAGVDVLPLVVEVGTLVDELVVGMEEIDLAPADDRPEPIQFFDRS